MGNLKVAAAQLAPVFFDRDRTVQKACAAIEEAGGHGARLVAFPESFIPGYPYFAMLCAPTAINDYMRMLYREAVQLPSPAVEQLCGAARRAGTYVVMGLHEREGGTLYNSQLFIGPDGTVLGCRRKLVPTSHERLVWGRGDGSDLKVYSTDIGVLGGLICYEHANALFRYALQAQREQIHIATWPGGMSSIDPIIDAAARHYAFEAQAFVVNVTSVLTPAALAGLPDELRDKLTPGGGHSAIISPRGGYLAGPVREGEQLVYAELDFELIDKLKSIVDTAGHYARPDVVRLKLNGARQRSLEGFDGFEPESK
ncbi:MAG TPA: carbon-nitrogen hydrolase family protein [Polyangiales bacterium]|nr:carbon-nitrogen hydrolase family protein [Polyangiales bacterium]